MKKNIIFIVLVLLLVSIKSQAQVSDLFEETQHRNGYVSFAKIKKEKLPKAKTEKETIPLPRDCIAWFVNTRSTIPKHSTRLK
ncbi:hypothetical protein D1614_22940 [Maribellus luteus]|uniref:Uncharacterized protein n=1 Tax=Maribellus luteus TaxID=2305463 RepID=A0A399SQ26_9BACT|nr:hypothetical protein [Maribellus luteus]RIJ45448.1 hypothetical protein D1614_22940 [Maribellus luteus]